ncbi:hypothetical protein [Streptosporangium sandarakinum]|uniref:hypothetical protein n=1 Tax=Streptosporangium sandarakinum TaxID=1260955 RepID=UPI0036C5E3A8
MAEEWFDRYLSERGYSADIPDDSDRKNPDRLITVPDGRQVVCEVKSFATFGLLKEARFREGSGGIRVSQPMARSQKEALQPIRDKIKEAAKQLKRYQDDGLPLMVILANPMNCPVPFDESSVIAAMYGDIDAVFEVTEPGAAHEGTSWLQAGRNGKLTSDHHYISAVALLCERPHSAAWATAWFDENRPRFDRIQDMIAAYLEVAEADSVPQGSEVFLTVIETIGEEAVRLPRDLFNGPLDLRCGPAPDGTGLTLLSDAQ